MCLYVVKRDLNNDSLMTDYCWVLTNATAGNSGTQPPGDDIVLLGWSAGSFRVDAFTGFGCVRV